MPQLHKILIIILLIPLVLIGVVIFLDMGAVTYTQDFDSSKFSVFNKTNQEMIELGIDVTSETTNLEGNPDTTDPVNSFFTSGYTAIKITGRAISSVFDLATGIPSMVSILPGSGFIKMIINNLLIVFIILIVVGIYLSIATRSERT